MCLYFLLCLKFLFNIFLIISNIIKYKLYFIEEEQYYENIKKMIVYNGPVFIKYFQIIVARRENNNQTNWAKINNKEVFSKKLICKIIELEDKVNNYFEIDNDLITKIGIKEKIASGSVANVYNCNYQQKKCVVKFFDHLAERKIKLGILTLKTIHFCNLYYFINLPKLNINFESYQKILLSQIVTQTECNNAEKLTNIFNNYSHLVKIPKIYAMEKQYIIFEKKNGLKFTDFIEKFPEKKTECVALLYGVLLKMIDNHFIHADFHLGNFLFELINEKVTITLLDFGICLELNENKSNILKNLINNSKNKLYIKQFVLEFCNHVDDNQLQKLDNIIDNSQPKNEVEIIFDIMSDLKINIVVINIFVTLHFLIMKINNIKKKNKKYIMNYLIDNDFID